MSHAVPPTWSEDNQRHLVAALARVRRALEGAADAGADGGDEAEIAASMPAPPALHRLRDTFRLSPFECDVLLACAGVELDTAFADSLRGTGGGPPVLTFGLALARLPGAHWSALAPTAPLRYWRLVEVAGGESSSRGPLRIDERILHHLTGTGGLDERLQGLAEPVSGPGALPPSHAAEAARLGATWGGPAPLAALPCLCGADGWAKRAVAAAACAPLGLVPFTMRAADVPAAAAEREALARLWEREVLLEGAALLIETDDADGTEALRAATAFAERVRGPVALAAREPLRTAGRPVMRLDVDRPGAAEQRALWHEMLGEAAASLNGRLEAIAAQFQLGAREIRRAGADALDAAGTEAFGDRLWEACRAQARPRLDELAQRIEGAAAWDDLVLAAKQKETLRQVVAHVRHRTRVYEEWGFARRGTRGLGISALFAGPSGTGKTLAAEVVAHTLGLDLYRIDLSQVVSKYIGETEKNLRRVFDAAEEGGAVLLFDEADALFGKRSEVKDAHDRYANIEVSYLLQRMESYRGLAVLTSNLQESMDEAFLRRIRFVIHFPFPAAEEREQIWRRAFPPGTPTDGLEPARLARLSVAGGNIRNIAMAAAFLAAAEDSPVRMGHLLRAARSEMVKLEKPLNAAEVAGWT